jgi:alkanesulfonate monooxygenase SsuD/methylene tetrahydromethanopterin reductase-like flavin-dependent oxidoreductase (luciferase family)
VVGKTHEEAERKAEPLRAMYRDLGYEETILSGEPDEVAEQTAALRALGLDAVVAAVPDPSDLDSLALTGRALTA